MDSNLKDLAEWAASERAGGQKAEDIADGVIRQILPPNYVVHDTDLERFRTNPRRKQGTFAFTEISGFCSYVFVHSQGDEGRGIFVDRAAETFTAYLNAHAVEDAGWHDHVATYTLTKTDAWYAWLKSNGRQMTQQEFAEFLEDRIGEIASPDGAELMEAVTNLKLVIGATFKSNVTMANGRIGFAYDEQIDGAHGPGGTLRLPEELGIVVQPYEGSSVVTVTARLRWRMDRNAGKVSFFYSLGDVPRQVRDEKMAEAFTQVAAALSNVPLYYGAKV